MSDNKDLDLGALFKAKRKGTNIRKREIQTNIGIEEDGGINRVNKKSFKSINPNLIRKANTNNNLIDNKKDSDSEEEEDEEKKIYRSGAITINYKADETEALLSDKKLLIGGATATVEIDTDIGRDYRALLEKKLANQEVVTATEDSNYKGQVGYNSYLKKRDTGSGSAAGSKMKAGPIRASGNIRITNRFDYQPDICKDYKETGFCGYGDSCKFLHDRGDYKAGWQLDREWEESQNEKKERNDKMLKDIQQAQGEVTDTTDDEEGLPFACLICRKSFVNPVVTKCGHYFCEACALKRFAKTPKCFACNGPTSGIFDVATNLIERINKVQPGQETPLVNQDEAISEIGTDSDDE